MTLEELAARIVALWEHGTAKYQQVGDRIDIQLFDDDGKTYCS